MRRILFAAIFLTTFPLVSARSWVPEEIQSAAIRLDSFSLADGSDVADAIPPQGACRRVAGCLERNGP